MARAAHQARHAHQAMGIQAALKKVLGDDVTQQGSIVRNDGLRFDFSLPRPMKQEEILQVEAVINRWIEVRGASCCCVCLHASFALGMP